MKQMSPLPIFEANCFFKNHINGFTTERFYQIIKKRFPKNEAEYKAQFDILLQVDAQLTLNIAITREEAELLYCPLSIKHDEDAVVAQDGLADILIPDIMAYNCTDCNDFFAHLRAEKPNIPTRIAAAVCPDEKPPAVCGTAELLALINGCDWRESSKLTLIELAFNPENISQFLNALSSLLLQHLRHAGDSGSRLSRLSMRISDCRSNTPIFFTKDSATLSQRRKDTMLFRQSRDSDKCFFRTGTGKLYGGYRCAL